MADEGTTVETQGQKAKSDDDGEQNPGTDWKAEARKWEQRAKENKGAADKLKKIEESEMSAIEKAQAEAKAAKAEAESLKAEKEREAWVKAASKKTGVPAELLRGSTEEEIEAHAESLKPYVGKNAAPVVDLGNPSSEEKPSEKAEFARQLFGRG